MSSIWNQPMAPYPTDNVHTESSLSQAQVEQLLLQTLTTNPPSPPQTLNRSAHAAYLGKHLLSLPAPYVSLDASRPWLTYWALHGFDLLGIGLDDEMRRRAIETVLAFQHPEGGFCGGPPPGHIAHLLPTYASIMTLAILCGDTSQAGGGTSEMGRKAWERVDRGKLYGFFLSCKRPDGGFVVCHGGEVDVRGIYCMLTCATLLDILTPELVHGTSQFLANCQTYEGGFASASFPSSFSPGTSGSPASTSSEPRMTGTEGMGMGSAAGMGMGTASAEAHGGYTSCAVFSWFLLRPLQQVSQQGEAQIRPSTSTSASIDLQAALRWAVMQQSYAIEGGGFRGRTNKLVDGCYGWWVGGLFAVLESVLGVGEEREREEREEVLDEDENQTTGDEAWEENEGKGMLFNRAALQEYILIAAQHEKGGLRDKPGKNPDLYHTTNNLSGLSSAQHHVRHSPSRVDALKAQWKPSPAPSFLIHRAEQGQGQGAWAETDQQRETRRREVWANARGWVEDDSSVFTVGGNVNRVNTTSPVFNALMLRIKPMVDHFYGQDVE